MCTENKISSFTSWTSVRLVRSHGYRLETLYSRVSDTFWTNRIHIPIFLFKCQTTFDVSYCKLKCGGISPCNASRCESFQRATSLRQYFLLWSVENISCCKCLRVKLKKIRVFKYSFYKLSKFVVAKMSPPPHPQTWRESVMGKMPWYLVKH